MLAECNEHGYYRGRVCPVCKKEGKFLMDDREIKKLSSILIGILRHFPQQFNIKLDPHGWANIDEVCEAIKNKIDRFYWIRKKHVVALALTDEKGRYQLKEGKIRATYAHTIEVDLSDLPEADVDTLYYPVTEEELEIVLEQGLLPTDRNKVHLSGSVEKAVEAGKTRVENPVILKIDAKKAMKDGVDIRKAGKEVYIADQIDAKYISILESSEASDQE
ncbi:MAG: RNA 2'-phosphotransferase [Thermoplasmata archaeon]|nr:MAG: RNA 2'-phosphotransferase [Thermoplasmata archaeon]HDN96271.1 RNA 2'-phosphotransferase [Thermoplasmatales archaeon]